MSYYINIVKKFESASKSCFISCMFTGTEKYLSICTSFLYLQNEDCGIEKITSLTPNENGSIILPLALLC